MFRLERNFGAATLEKQLAVQTLFNFKVFDAKFAFSKVLNERASLLKFRIQRLWPNVNRLLRKLSSNPPVLEKPRRFSLKVNHVEV